MWVLVGWGDRLIKAIKQLSALKRKVASCHDVLFLCLFLFFNI